ncbi:Dynein light chain [Mycena kentingensis (nom. inval.)]|nr:Dynein light chain [Mycena kentingensis (nom. inval.)]
MRVHWCRTRETTKNPGQHVSASGSTRDKQQHSLPAPSRWPRKLTRLPHPPTQALNVDMSDEMQQESVDIASAALEKYNIEKDIAAQIKKEFDRRHGPTWHVVVGKNFGSYVTHETKHFIYFYVGSLAILIWKS